MRDTLLLMTLLAVVPLMLRAPLIGLLAWIWITLMNPQREVYGFLAGFQLNLWVAALTAVAWLGSRERKVAPLNPVALLLGLFAVWAGVSVYFAIDRASALAIGDRTVKSLILALAVLTLANTRSRIQAVLWMVVASLGYYAVKGGGFVLMTGGRQHVYGPDNSMISDNNALGLAMIVLLPMLNYLRLTSQRLSVRLACTAVSLSALVAIIGTYSRGALVTLMVTATAYALRSRVGMLLLVVGGMLLITLPSLLPASWLERMSTIHAYKEDASFAGRVAAWKTSVNIARARPLTGGGFAAVELASVAQRYRSPGSLEGGRAAHSIYFEVLGDTGVVGLALYLLLLGAAWLNTWIVIGTAFQRHDLRWAAQLARMLQLSLVAIMVGGAALSMAYYDGFLVLLALTAALVKVVRSPAPVLQAGPAAPRWKQLAGRTAAAG